MSALVYETGLGTRRGQIEVPGNRVRLVLPGGDFIDVIPVKNGIEIHGSATIAVLPKYGNVVQVRLLA